MISVVLATHNEAKNLERCLRSVQAWADEIIVVDGESTDDTIKIAKKFNAHIITTTNKTNFHINKQLGMDKAKGLLVLQLDADEEVDVELKNFILTKHTEYQHKKITSDSIVAWWLPRKNLFLGTFMRKGGQYPDPVIRLYVNGYAKLPQKDVHEQMSVDGQVGWASGHLIHYANPTFSEYLTKFNRYTSFKAEQLAADGIKITWFNTWKYLIWLPKKTFLLMYFRHKGFMDGMAGFVFAMMSGLHHAVAYLKLWELQETIKQTHVKTK